MFLPYADDPPPEARFPWMNWLLIALNCAVFMAYGSLPYYDQIVMHYGFIPADFTVTTLFTSMFLHGSWMHLLGNMWFLYLFGDNVENRTGPFKYLIAYIICGVAGDYSHYLFFPDSTIPTIGASGAIFGVMGMYLFLFPRNRVKVLYFIFILIGQVSIPAFWVIGAFAGMELLYSRMMATGGLESDIGHLAHAGGFVAGAVLTLLYAAFGLIPVYGRELFAGLFDFKTSEPDDRDRPINARFRMLDNEDRAPRTGDPRAGIVALLRSGRMREAQREWLQLAAEDRNVVLPVVSQLELAIALDRDGQREAARDAYERLITHYPNEQPYAAEANLALAGMLLSEMQTTGDRHEIPLIERLLQQVVRSHPQPARRALALRWLQALGHG